MEWKEREHSAPSVYLCVKSLHLLSVWHPNIKSLPDFQLNNINLWRMGKKKAKKKKKVVLERTKERGFRRLYLLAR